VLSEQVYSELVGEVDAALGEGGNVAAHAASQPAAPVEQGRER
jgi:hypothetical protein